MSVRSDLYFAQIPEWLLYADISPQAIRLYCVLDRYANEKRHAHPSRKALADAIHASKDTVDRALRELQEAGAVEVTHRKDELGDLTSNDYLVHKVADGRRTDAVTGGGEDAVTVAAQVRQEPEPVEPEPSEPEKDSASPVSHHLLFEALCNAMGRQPAGGEGGRWGKTAKLMAGAGVSPPEVTERARLYRREWPDVEFNPSALWLNWGRFDPAAAKNGHGVSARTRELAAQLRSEGR